MAILFDVNNQSTFVCKLTEDADSFVSTVNEATEKIQACNELLFNHFVLT